MIRFGVIGTNKITGEFIAAARETEDFELTAVYSRTTEKAEMFAAQHHIPNTFTSMEELAQSAEIDAVYIASPNSFHAKQAILCMNHGKHVLCEKPIASNADELKAMISAAQTNKVLLMEAMKSTLLPNFLAVREGLPQIGKIRRYLAGYSQYSSRYDAYKQGTVLNAFNPEFSNGALMDLGIYCIYPMVVLFGKPDLIKATGLLLDSGVDGEGSILAQYKDMEAVITYSKITDSYLPSEIQGEQGSILVNGISHLDQVEIHRKAAPVENISKPQLFRSMTYEVREFINLLNNNKLESLTNSHLNSLIAMEIMDEVRQQIGLVYPADLLIHETY